MQTTRPIQLPTRATARIARRAIAGAAVLTVAAALQGVGAGQASSTGASAAHAAPAAQR